MRKGKIFYKLGINKNLYIEFVHENYWDMAASVQAIIHKDGENEIKTAMIDTFVPGEEQREYDFIKSKKGVIGVYRKDSPERIIMVFDQQKLIHIPFISKGYNEDKEYRKEVDQMAELFFLDNPTLEASFR